MDWTRESFGAGSWSRLCASDRVKLFFLPPLVVSSGVGSLFWPSPAVFTAGSARAALLIGAPTAVALANKPQGPAHLRNSTIITTDPDFVCTSNTIIDALLLPVDANFLKRSSTYIHRASSTLALALHLFLFSISLPFAILFARLSSPVLPFLVFSFASLRLSASTSLLHTPQRLSFPASQQLLYLRSSRQRIILVFLQNKTTPSP